MTEVSRRGWVAACLAFVAAGLLVAPGPATAKPRPKVYSVIFEVTIDEAGKLTDLKVAKVTDPASGSTAAVDVPVPDAYIAAVRAQIEKGLGEPKAAHYFTYFFYDPRTPDIVKMTPY